MDSMEHNLPDNDLLVKYLLNEVNTEEEAFVTGWINADVQNRQAFEAFEKTWLLTAIKKNQDEVNVDEEWSRLKRHIENIKGGEVKTVTTTQWQTSDELETNRRGKIYKLIVSIAVAASVLLIVAFGLNLFNSKKDNVINTVVIEKMLKDSAVAVLRHETNTTGKPKKVLLQDGTVVWLEDKSEIRFAEPFETNKRIVTLEGAANFKVAKDKSRPFTVYSDAIGTTVLGTVFDVSSYKQSATITVRLYEGKVVVKSATTAARKMSKDVYLAPGYEMLYNKQTAVANVRSFGKQNATVDTLNNTGIITPDNLNIPRKSGSWYMFNNQPLSQVFDQLKEMYKSQIMYNKKDMRKLYFIGQFNRADSLEMILDQITKANDLKLTKTNDTFFISK